MNIKTIFWPNNLPEKFSNRPGGRWIPDRRGYWKYSDRERMHPTCP